MAIVRFRQKHRLQQEKQLCRSAAGFPAQGDAPQLSRIPAGDKGGDGPALVPMPTGEGSFPGRKPPDKAVVCAGLREQGYRLVPTAQVQGETLPVVQGPDRASVGNDAAAAGAGQAGLCDDKAVYAV